jgi:hypothetical protein
MAETVAAQPLADDVTAEELAARPEQPRAPRNKSTEEAYASSANKWWPMFLKAVCWDGTEKGVFIDAAGDPIDGTFSQLFIWLYEQDGMTKSIYKAMLAWAQARLNKQRAERLLAPMPGYVCNLPGIKERKSELFTGARDSHMEHTGAVDPDAAEAAGLGMSPIAARLDKVISRRLAPLGAKIKALLGTISQAGPATAAPAVMPLHSLLLTGARDSHMEHTGAVEPDAAEAAGLGMSPIAARLDNVISRRLAPLDAKIEALLGTISQAGRATAAPAVMPLPSHEPKRKRKTTEESAAAQAAKRGPGGIPTYVLAPNKETVARLWEEYTTGLNGGPAVRNLIHDYGRKWRPPGDASRQLWRWHSYVYEEIERRMKAGESEVDALAGVQARLDAHAKPKRTGRGRPACPANWSGLVRELQAAHPRRVEDVEADV